MLAKRLVGQDRLAFVNGWLASSGEVGATAKGRSLVGSEVNTVAHSGIPVAWDGIHVTLKCGVGFHG